ncbi:MAG: hypothetical protein LBM70_06780 [Victivallales bacterium]|jgi:hypothetical protein|nr:hypothetical protein [Victivallales bacterium]
MKRKILQYDVAHGRLPLIDTIIEQTSLLKRFGLTGVMFYMEAEGAVDSLPIRGRIGAVYLLELKKKLQELEIEFIPQIQVLGHLSQLLMHQKMAAWRDDPAGGECIRIDLPEVRQGIKSYLREVVGYFDSDYVHCGGDEAFTLGLGRSGSYFKTCGFENAVADYLNDLNDAIQAMGKKMVLYADELIEYPLLQKKLAADIIIANWGYCATDEIFELENRHYAAHDRVTANRENWITGNAMGEYIFLPFHRLKDNMNVLLELGKRSNATTFVISDWGSSENINPILNTTLGSIYLLRRLEDSSYSEEQFSEETASLILNSPTPDFMQAFKIMLQSQSEVYWPKSLCRRGPMFPLLLCGDPDDRVVISYCAVLEQETIVKLEKDLRWVSSVFAAIPDKRLNNAEWFHDLQAIARRLLLTVIRTSLCREHTWYAGAIWLNKATIQPSIERYESYRKLAEEDLTWHRKYWKRDHQKTGLNRSCHYLEQAIKAGGKTLHCPENSLLFFTPQQD